jgi:hypothetical protein
MVLRIKLTDPFEQDREVVPPVPGEVEAVIPGTFGLPELLYFRR